MCCATLTSIARTATTCPSTVHGAWTSYTPKLASELDSWARTVTTSPSGMTPYSKAGNDLLSAEQKRLLGWVGNHDDFERTPSVVNRGDILEASATLAMITEPQQSVWVRHLLLKVFETGTRIGKGESAVTHS